MMTLRIYIRCGCYIEKPICIRNVTQEAPAFIYLLSICRLLKAYFYHWITIMGSTIIIPQFKIAIQ